LHLQAASARNTTHSRCAAISAVKFWLPFFIVLSALILAFDSSVFSHGTDLGKYFVVIEMVRTRSSDARQHQQEGRTCHEYR
jgi:hypothetical protein